MPKLSLWHEAPLTTNSELLKAVFLMKITSREVHFEIVLTFRHNFYSSLALSGLVEIPAGGLAMFMMGYSRRVTVSLTLVSWGLVGLISPLSIALPQLRSTFIFYCKSCASAAFCHLFVCTSEVLPTQVYDKEVPL